MAHNKYLPIMFKVAASDLGSAGSTLDYTELKPALDVADGLSRVINNKKLYFRLLESFSGRKMADDINAAIESGDHSQVRNAAHALKGVSANLGMPELVNISLQIEMRAKEEAAAGYLLPALDQAVEAATVAIERLLASEES